jgi:hypothetical protein
MNRGLLGAMRRVMTALPLVFSLVAMAAPSGNDSRAADDALSARARDVLHQIAATDPGWVRIHAVEVLAAYGEGASMRKIFLGEARTAAASPQRIGIWRVLAATSPTTAERLAWIAPIESVSLKPGDPDRLRALESLGKLHYIVTGGSLQAARRLAAEAPPKDAPLPLWALQLAGDPTALGRLGHLLEAEDPVARQRAAYALRWLRPDDPAVLHRLAQAADNEPPGSVAYPFLVSAALALNADPERASVWQAKLERLAVGSSADARFEASQTLMPYCTAATLPLIAGLLDDPDNNTRVGAAWTILYAQAHGIGRQ